MADLVSFPVLRGHLGDKITDDGVVQHYFEPGETREAERAVVAHLIPNVLEDPEAGAGKADQAHEDKAEGNSPDDKAAKAPKTKG